jgi:hypothetical protein
MIGEAPETAIPHIMFSCQQSGPRKEAMRALKKSGILSNYPGIEVGHWQFPPHIMRPQPLAADPRSSLCAFQSTKVILSPFNTTPSKEPLRTSRLTISAMGIRIPSSSHPNTAIATTSSGMYFAGKLFYMTVSHPFEEVLEVPDDDDGSEFEFGGFNDIEGELDDDQLEALHDGSMTSLSSGSQPSENSTVDDHAIIAWPESLKPPGSEDSTKPEPVMSCSQNDQELDMSFTSPQISEHIGDGYGHSDTGYAEVYLVSTDLDYALIEYTNDNSIVSALPFPLLASETARKVPSGQTRVTILTGRHGQLSGILGGQPSYIRLTCSRTFQETFNVQINGPLMPGDCGSMVIDSETGFLYGHIVVGSTLSRIAYIIPAVNVLRDLKTHEHVQTCLTAKSDSSPQTEKCGDTVPLVPIGVHSNSREALLPGSKQVPPPEHVGKDEPLPADDAKAFVHDRSERSELEIIRIEPHSIPKSRYREAFLLYLKDIQRTNWQKKIFYSPSDVRLWMNTKSLGETCTNIEGLVSTLYGGPPPIYDGIQAATPLKAPAENGHCNLISFLAAAQACAVDLHPIVWHPVENLVARGGTADIRQRMMSQQFSFIFKGMRISDNTTSHKDPATKERQAFQALIAEILVLTQPSIRNHPNIINLEGICWEISADGKAWPVLMFEKAEFGDLDEFMKSDEGKRLDFQASLQLCKNIAGAIAVMHLDSKYTTKLI